MPKISIGVRYGNSNFNKKICSDEDWGFWGLHNGVNKYIEYQITKQDSKSKVEHLDLNFYYRLLDFDEDLVRQIRSSSQKRTIFDELLIERLSLDIFAGYQSQKGRYNMLDPMTEYWRIVDGTLWYATGLPSDVGLDSFYEVHYKGPRFGIRAEGSRGKVTTRCSLAYALLTTEAYGWWNIRDYTFEQEGENGYGLDIETEMTYKFNSNFSFGLGFDYFFHRQKKLKESGNLAGSVYSGLDIIRNVDSKIYSPSIILKYIW